MFEAFLDVVVKLEQTAVLDLPSIIVRAHHCAWDDLVQKDLQHHCSAKTETAAVAHASLPSEFCGLELDGSDCICVEIAVDVFQNHFGSVSKLKAGLIINILLRIDRLDLHIRDDTSGVIGIPKNIRAMKLDCVHSAFLRIQQKIRKCLGIII